MARLVASRDLPLEQHGSETRRLERRYGRRGFTYFYLMDGERLIGAFAVGAEPLNQVEPPGTVVGEVTLLHDDAEAAERIAEESLRLSRLHGAKATTVSLEDAAIARGGAFLRRGFRILDDALWMDAKLGGFNEDPGLELRRVSLEGLRGYLEASRLCMSGSGDALLELSLPHSALLPDGFLDEWFLGEEFYNVHSGGRLVGVLDLYPRRGILSNMGVHPEYRGRGFGRRILAAGLARLRAAGNDVGTLRVGAENAPALSLYRSAGFRERSREQTLVWYP